MYFGRVNGLGGLYGLVSGQVQAAEINHGCLGYDAGPLRLGCAGLLLCACLRESCGIFCARV